MEVQHRGHAGGHANSTLDGRGGIVREIQSSGVLISKAHVLVQEIDILGKETAGGERDPLASVLSEVTNL